MVKSDSDRLDELEIIAAHQARTIEDLNETIIRQGRENERLGRIVEALVKRLQVMEEQISPDIPVTKPPHW
jgi:SlyX protein